MVQTGEPLVDIHCHLIPAIDDGSKSWEESLAMARMAARDGTAVIIVTPHQLGNYAHNDAATIRSKTAQLGQFLDPRWFTLRV